MFPSFTVFSCRGLQGGVLTLWVLYLKENVVDQIPVFLFFFWELKWTQISKHQIKLTQKIRMLRRVFMPLREIRIVWKYLKRQSSWKTQKLTFSKFFTFLSLFRTWRKQPSLQWQVPWKQRDVRRRSAGCCQVSRVLGEKIGGFPRHPFLQSDVNVSLGLYKGSL